MGGLGRLLASCAQGRSRFRSRCRSLSCFDTGGASALTAHAMLSLMLGAALLAGALDPTSPFLRFGPAERPPAPYARAVPTPLGPGFARGVCYPSPTTKELEFGTPGCRDALKAIRATGADTVSLCPFFLIGHRSPFLPTRFPGGVDREAVRQTIVWAHEVGLKVILRPQIVTKVKHPRFKLKITHKEDWREVFAVLDVMLRDMGQLAEDTHCEALSLGTRMEDALTWTPDNWRILIGRVRQVYRGQLTYDADWRRELDRVTFWEQLDFISLTFYKRLGEADDLDDDPVDDVTLFKNASWPSGRLSEIWYRYRKPVWFSELGVPSNEEGLRHPYQRPLIKDALPDPVLQQRALFQSLLVYQDKRWLAGVMVWAFDGPGGPTGTGYCPQGKPAWDTLKLWFAPGPARSPEFRDRKDLIPWIDDWF